jgi:hypothetical protein
MRSGRPTPSGPRTPPSPRPRPGEEPVPERLEHQGGLLDVLQERCGAADRLPFPDARGCQATQVTCSGKSPAARWRMVPHNRSRGRRRARRRPGLRAPGLAVGACGKGSPGVSVAHCDALVADRLHRRPQLGRDAADQHGEDDKPSIVADGLDETRPFRPVIRWAVQRSPCTSGSPLSGNCIGDPALCAVHGPCSARRGGQRSRPPLRGPFGRTDRGTACAAGAAAP